MDMERVLRLGVRLLPADRDEWDRALVAELDAVPPAARSRWAQGRARFVLQELVIRPGLYCSGWAGPWPFWSGWTGPRPTSPTRHPYWSFYWAPGWRRHQAALSLAVRL